MCPLLNCAGAAGVNNVSIVWSRAEDAGRKPELRDVSARPLIGNDVDPWADPDNGPGALVYVQAHHTVIKHSPQPAFQASDVALGNTWGAMPRPCCYFTRRALTWP
jgi:hypothetical protein